MSITIQITIKTTQEEFKQCIAAAWEKRFQEHLDTDELGDYNLQTEMPESDIKNILMGSCLGELLCDSETTKLKRIR